MTTWLIEYYDIEMDRYCTIRLDTLAYIGWIFLPLRERGPVMGIRPEWVHQ